MPLRVSAYVGEAELPDEIVTSVRCIVKVGSEIVVCTNRDGTHPMPGGRREPGESFVQTAAREVEEETGWLIRPGSFGLIGWLHLEHLKAQPADWPYPHPDFCQVVGVAEARERIGGRDSQWADTDGYELVSRLLSMPDALSAVSGQDLLSSVFLEAL